MDNAQKVKELRVFAEEIRLETLKEFSNIGFGHVGGAMSIVELLAVLYGSEMKFDPKNPKWEDRDYLVVSKGHAGPAVYATLAMLGYFPEEMLHELNQGGGHLPSHCDRNKTPGIDMTTGSLGQGISAACGIALGQRLDKRKSYAFLVLGDGECNEGQIWEGAAFAAQYKLDNLIAFVDLNGQQLDGYAKDIMDMSNMGERFRSFRWNVQEVNGHDVGEVLNAVRTAKQSKGAPNMIILHTIKGHGCTFSEGVKDNHHQNFKPEQMKEALSAAEKMLEAAKAAAAR